MKIDTVEYLKKRIAVALVEDREKRKQEKLNEAKARIELGRARTVLLQDLVKESLELLDEADAPMSDPMGAPAAGPATTPPAPPPPPTGQPTDMGTPPMDAPTGLDSTGVNPNPEITLEKVIAKLNTIRGGKSLRDPMIYNKLNTYYQSLDDEKKNSLFDFLSNIAQVITDIVDGAAPPAPPAGEMDLGMQSPMDEMPPAPPPPPPSAPATPPPPAQPPTPIQPAR